MPRHISPFRLEAQPMNAEAVQAARFRWADAEVGTRHRLGGYPEDLAESEYPRCPDCGQTMTFYGQLDSIGDEIALADVGVVQVFVCFDCFEATARVSST